MADYQQQVDIPLWVSRIVTGVALFFIGTISLGLLLHIFKPNQFPAPNDLGSEGLIAISLIAILAVHFPWSRISFGGVEIERILQQQALDYVEDASYSEQKNTGETMPRNGIPESALESGFIPKKFSLSDLLLKFFQNHTATGFTPQAIQSASRGQAGFEALADLSLIELRTSLTELVETGSLRIRVSSHGHVLYQINK